MIVQYVGKGQNKGEAVKLEYRNVSRELFTIPRGGTSWIPDDYCFIDPKTGTDYFKEWGITIIQKPIPLQPKAFARAKDGDSLLVVRQYGGFGDILMQTMIWPNLRRQFPTSTITYSIPLQFHDLMEGNPSLDEVVNLHTSNKRRFDHQGDISRVCGMTEIMTKPCTTHRSDIWGEHLGVLMETHEGFYLVKHDERAWAKGHLAALRPRPIVGLVPFSADKRKDLPKDTVQSLIDRLVLDIGAEVLVLHHQPTTFLRAHSIHELNFRWLGALVNELDLLISVDTGTLHLGAMLKRPVLAIYGSEDGRVFTKYYPTVRLIQPFTRLCQPCWYSAPCLDGEPKNSRPGDCMMDLTADQLAQEATLMLQDSGRW